MNEELKVIISAETSKLKQAINDAKSQFDSFKQKVTESSKDVDDKIKKLGDGIGSAVKTGVKAATTAIAGMGAAVAGIVTSAINNYAEYEQLVGGVEKLFGDSADTVMKYAQDAYKNAGVSANDYMSQITSFSASLISSLGGDTVAAAEIGNMAINDMSDNANVFGSNIEDIQNAYQGFAKQNYTMLDNLKLGYGGTKTEMERLISDANKILETMGQTGDLTIEEFGDVITAIHLVQEEMGVTGTTAKEAEGTISGSITMMKTSWENLLTGLADGNADIPQLVSNVLSSATSVIENIIPVAKEALRNIPVAISEISPEAGAAMQTVVDFAIEAFPVLQEAVQTAFDVVSGLFTFISQNQGLLAGMATIIGVVAAAVTAYNVVAAVKAAMAAAEVTTVWGLVTAYTAQAAAMAVALAPYIAIAAAIAAVIAIIVLCVQHWDEIKAKVAEVWTAMAEKVQEGVEKVKNFFSEMGDNIREKAEEIKGKISEKFNQIKDTIGNVMQAAKDVAAEKLSNMRQAYEENGGGIKGAVAAAWEGIKGYYTSGFSFVDNLTGGKLSEIVNSFRSKFDSIKQSVSDRLTAIKDKFSSILENAKNIVRNAIDKIKNFFKFEWSLPKLKLPHFSITGKLDLLVIPPQIPKLSVDWYAKGGVFDSPSLFNYGNGLLGGLGENGAEAVVPLENNLAWLDKLAGMLNERMGSSAPITLEVDGKTFAQISIDSINALTKQRGSLALNLV